MAARGKVTKLPVKIKVPGGNPLGGVSAPKKMPQSQQLGPALSAAPFLAAPAPAPPPPLPTADEVRGSGAWKDSGWSTAVANIQAGKSQGLAKIATQRGYNQADFDRNKGLTEEGRGKTLGGTRNAANSQGLLYSGILSEREGDVNTDFNRRQEGLLDTFTRTNRGLDEQEQDINLATSAAEREAEEAAVIRYLEALARRQAA